MDAYYPLPLRRLADHGHWELILRDPDPRLRPWVHGPYQGYLESGKRRIRRKEVPSALVPLIVNMGPAWRMFDPRHPAEPPRLHDSFVAGLSDTYTVVEPTGASLCMQVNFTPIGAHRFFGVPMDTLTNCVVDLENIVGPMACHLAARLYEAPSWEVRFAILDSVLAARLAAGREPSAEIVRAWHRLTETGGCLDIGTLASEIGWSRKHLIARFREQIGMPPKLVARILRFNRVTRLLERDTGERWAEIAYECGYYDQAHLIRDFREFAGSTPSDLLAHRLPHAGLAAD
jgi:AraC-like DNA-binding protein